MTAKHHKLIHALVVEVRRLRQELDYANDQQETNRAAVLSMQEHHGRLQREAEYRAQQNQEAADYRAYQYQQAAQNLERARSWGDIYAEERAIKKLKSIY